MSRILNLISSATTKPASAWTGEDVVREAESRGQLEIGHDFGSKAYKAEIRFQSKNGSRIWAAGIDIDFFTAIAKAVQEAERLK